MEDICFERDSLGDCHCDKVSHPRVPVTQPAHYPEDRKWRFGRSEASSPVDQDGDTD